MDVCVVPSSVSPFCALATPPPSLPVCLSTSVSVSVSLSLCLSLSVFLSVSLSVRLSLSVSLSYCLSLCLSLSVFFPSLSHTLPIVQGVRAERAGVGRAVQQQHHGQDRHHQHQRHGAQVQGGEVHHHAQGELCAVLSYLQVSPPFLSILASISSLFFFLYLLSLLCFYGSPSLYSSKLPRYLLSFVSISIYFLFLSIFTTFYILSPTFRFPAASISSIFLSIYL